MNVTQWMAIIESIALTSNEFCTSSILFFPDPSHVPPHSSSEMTSISHLMGKTRHSSHSCHSRQSTCSSGSVPWPSSVEHPKNFRQTSRCCSKKACSIKMMRFVIAHDVLSSFLSLHDRTYIITRATSSLDDESKRYPVQEFRWSTFSIGSVLSGPTFVCVSAVISVDLRLELKTSLIKIQSSQLNFAYVFQIIARFYTRWLKFASAMSSRSGGSCSL